MKSILLTTTALVAFAGAAAADGHAGISFSGSATLGYNSSAAGEPTGDHDGFYADMNLDVSMVAALDNGITVTATADVDELDASDWEFDGVTLEIASEMASLTFGDTDTSADLHWDGVDGSTTEDFGDRDRYLDCSANTDCMDAIIRGEATMGGVTASISYAIEVNDGAGMDYVDGLQVAAVADLGGFTVIGAYQGETGDSWLDSNDAIMGLSVAGAVAGVDVMGSYVTDGTETSTGVSGSMPFGPVTVGAYYSMNDVGDNKYGLDVAYSDGPISVSADFDTDDNDTTDPTWEIDANYDTGLGAIIHAGMNSGDDMYVAGTYDLGSGATLLVSYATDEDDSADDEVGEDDLQVGTTVAVSFSF